MVALWNRETIYIFMLWFVLSSSSSFFFSMCFVRQQIFEEKKLSSDASIVKTLLF